MNRRWTWMAVQAKRGETRAAAHRVEQAGFRSYCPLVKSDTGKRIVPLFDEYFFAGWCPEWFRVNHVRGVDRVMTMDGKPGIVRRNFIVALQARENKRGIVELDDSTSPRPTRFNMGDSVYPKCGTWLGQLGVVQGAGRGHLVGVLFSLLGRPVLAEIDEGDLVAAGAA